MIFHTTPISQIDWDSPGKRLYAIPFTLDGTWGRVRVPLCVIGAGRPGKTVVAIGGTHGNEYEGPVGLRRLVADLDGNALIAGRLVVIPVLNVPAFQAARRESPLDGGNMNRAFPGRADGTITSRIARFMSDEVLPRADVVIDIHAAGDTYEIARCASFHLVDDTAQFQAMRETGFAFGMPWIWIYPRGMGSGLLTEHAESLGKITIGGEFGYGASTDLQGVRWAHHGVLNIMRLHGLLRGSIEPLLPPEYDRQRFVSSADLEMWQTAPVSGISEPLVPLGTFVKQGQPVARIHDFERIDEPAVEIAANLDGYLLVRRFRAQTSQGDVVAVVGQELS
ncbi:MAG: succinylglutamate desuccinylase [Armatimonadota bacterium]